MLCCASLVQRVVQRKFLRPSAASCAHTHAPPLPTPPQGEDGKWNKFGGRLAWDKSAICANSTPFGGTGAYKTTDDYPAAPNVDHSQVFVRRDICEWLNWMRVSVGFVGWRVVGGGGCSGEAVRE